MEVNRSQVIEIGILQWTIRILSPVHIRSTQQSDFQCEQADCFLKRMHSRDCFKGDYQYHFGFYTSMTAFLKLNPTNNSTDI